MTNTSDMTSQLLEKLLAAQAAGQSVVLATVVKTQGSVPRHAGSKMLVYADGRIEGTIGGGEMEARVLEESLAALKEGRPRLISYSLVDPGDGDPGLCGGQVEVYIEPYRPPASLLIVGCGHVGRALAHLAAWLGFNVAATDDRQELVTAELMPQAHTLLPGSFDDALASFQVTGNTYVVLVTRNVLVDRQILPKLLPTPAPYIGVIGSRKRWLETRKLLLEDGLSETELARFHSPVGLELNAETPEEIAVSIMAEIIMWRRGGSGHPMAGGADRREKEV
jgi:xanthine dehydrogenase accessory factor